MNNVYGNNIIKNCIFEGNFAYNGAAMDIGGGSSEVVNCKFLNNETPSPGFGCIFIENASPKIIGCLIANNNANGILFEDASLEIVNSTIINNNHDFGSGIFFGDNAISNIKNCIIYGNQANNSGYGNQIN